MKPLMWSRAKASGNVRYKALWQTLNSFCEQERQSLSIIKTLVKHGREFLTTIAIKIYVTHLFLMHPFPTPWKHQETLRFSGGRERVHWKQRVRFSNVFRGKRKGALIWEQRVKKNIRKQHWPVQTFQKFRNFRKFLIPDWKFLWHWVKRSSRITSHVSLRVFFFLNRIRVRWFWNRELRHLLHTCI